MDAKLSERGLHPLGIFRGLAVAACERTRGDRARLRGAAPARARTGIRMDQIDLWELNEAFAVQVIYCRDKLGSDGEANVDGAPSPRHPTA